MINANAPTPQSSVPGPFTSPTIGVPAPASTPVSPNRTASYTAGAPQKPKSKYSLKMLGGLLVLVLLIGGALASYALVFRSADVRQQAFLPGDPDGTCGGCTRYNNEGSCYVSASAGVNSRCTGIQEVSGSVCVNSCKCGYSSGSCQGLGDGATCYQNSNCTSNNCSGGSTGNGGSAGHCVGGTAGGSCYDLNQGCRQITGPDCAQGVGGGKYPTETLCREFETITCCVNGQDAQRTRRDCASQGTAGACRACWSGESCAVIQIGSQANCPNGYHTGTMAGTAYCGAQINCCSATDPSIAPFQMVRYQCVERGGIECGTGGPEACRGGAEILPIESIFFGENTQVCSSSSQGGIRYQCAEGMEFQNVPGTNQSICLYSSYRNTPGKMECVASIRLRYPGTVGTVAAYNDTVATCRNAGGSWSDSTCSCTGGTNRCASIVLQNDCNGTSGCRWTGTACTSSTSTSSCDQFTNATSCNGSTDPLCTWTNVQSCVPRTTTSQCQNTSAIHGVVVAGNVSAGGCAFVLQCDFNGDGGFEFSQCTNTVTGSAATAECQRICPGTTPIGTDRCVPGTARCGSDVPSSNCGSNVTTCGPAGAGQGQMCNTDGRWSPIQNMHACGYGSSSTYSCANNAPRRFVGCGNQPCGGNGQQTGYTNCYEGCTNGQPNCQVTCVCEPNLSCGQVGANPGTITPGTTNQCSSPLPSTPASTPPSTPPSTPISCARMEMLDATGVTVLTQTPPTGTQVRFRCVGTQPTADYYFFTYRDTNQLDPLRLIYQGTSDLTFPITLQEFMTVQCNPCIANRECSDATSVQNNCTFQIDRRTTSPSPTPSPVGPQCLNISMTNVTRPTAAVTADPRLGDAVTFTCGEVAGASRYIFRVQLPNGQVQALSATGRTSQQLNIAEPGRYYAQCQICTGTAESTCMPFETLPADQEGGI